ncbi:MAG: hypothetical protein P8Y91_10040 [Desulfuromonadales bacterium]
MKRLRPEGRGDTLFLLRERLPATSHIHPLGFFQGITIVTNFTDIDNHGFVSFDRIIFRIGHHLPPSIFWQAKDQSLDPATQKIVSQSYYLPVFIKHIIPSVCGNAVFATLGGGKLLPFLPKGTQPVNIYIFLKDGPGRPTTTLRRLKKGPAEKI